MGMTYRFYDAERVGALPGNYSIPWRGPAFLQEVGPKAQGFGNMTGGFMTGALCDKSLRCPFEFSHY